MFIFRLLLIIYCWFALFQVFSKPPRSREDAIRYYVEGTFFGCFLCIPLFFLTKGVVAFTPICFENDVGVEWMILYTSMALHFGWFMGRTYTDDL